MMLRLSELHAGRTLGVFAITALLTLILVYHLTREPIRIAAERQLDLQLSQLLVPDSFDNDPSADRIDVNAPTLHRNENTTIYRARKQGQPTGVVISAVAPDGYNGEIGLLVGLTHTGKIVAVRVTSHRETPGLGDEIEVKHSNWIYSFNDLPAADLNSTDWAVRKNGGKFDQFTGATITPSAVIRTVQRVAIWFEQYREVAFSASPDNDADQS